MAEEAKEQETHLNSDIADTWQSSVDRRLAELSYGLGNHRHRGYDFTTKLDFDSLGSSGSVREIFIPAEAMNPTTTAGCASLAKIEAGTNDVDYWVLDFDTSTAESCFFTIRMPDNWDSTTVTFVFIWTNASGLTTETVVFGIKGRAYADSDAIDQAYGTEVTTTDTWLAQNDIHLSPESSAVTLAGTPAAGQWCQFKITRKVASDDLTGDARLIGVRLKYYIT